jgi:sec-independent protein translocase protein TatA
MGSFSWVHWLVVIVLVLVLFGGRGKISELMGDFAKGIKSFKKGMAEEEAEVAKGESVKSIDHAGGATTSVASDLKGRAEAERRVEGSAT